MTGLELSLFSICLLVFFGLLLGIAAGYFIGFVRARAATLEVQQTLSHSMRDLDLVQHQLQAKQTALDDLDNRCTQLTRQKHELDVEKGRLEQQLVAKSEREETFRQELQQIQERLEQTQERFTSLHSEHTRLQTSLQEREKQHEQQIEQFHQQRSALSAEFKVLANTILEEKTMHLQTNTSQSINNLMDPFQKSIEAFKKEVADIHHRETVQQGELRQELKALLKMNETLSFEAHELSNALKGQAKLRGNWGELVLENVLDRAGLQPDIDYRREVSFTTEAGRFRPDVIVYLPQEKHLVIDAKVSLNAYMRYVNSDDEILRAKALREHVQAVSERIKELANKDYYTLPGLNSPEMVFMFIPVESAFVEALKADDSLFQRAIENNVLVATPTTLLTSLNIVRQLWRFEDQNKHTAALANKAEAVFKKLNSFLKSFSDVKKGLDKASESFVQAENQLLSGKGNLVKHVNEFKQLAPAIKQELPTYFTEKAILEIDLVPAEISDKSPAEVSDD